MVRPSLIARFAGACREKIGFAWRSNVSHPLLARATSNRTYKGLERLPSQSHVLLDRGGIARQCNRALLLAAAARGRGDAAADRRRVHRLHALDHQAAR